MEKIGIKYRLFLAFLLATATVAACLVLVAQWSLDRGFLRYVNTLEQDRLENLAGELEQAYAEYGSWEFLRRDPDAWLRLMVRTLPADLVDARRLGRLERRLERRARRGEPSGRHRGGPAHSFEMRVLLLDAQKQPVFGPPAPPGLDLHPLEEGGRVVGYLGLPPRKALYDARQLRFVRQQKLALALIAGIALAVSALIALPLARRLVRPIRALADVSHRLAKGEYAARVPVTRSDELGRLARDFNALAAGLEQNEQARRQWVADISHELRTPLSVLRGEVEALQDGVRQASPEALASLHGEILQLGRLVDDLYQLSLSDLGALNYRKQEMDLRTVLEAAVDACRPAFAERGLQCVGPAPGRPLRLFADPERLRQLCDNLLENALRYTDPGGRLEVALAAADGRATLDFRDSGPGVAEADLARLFDRLYRVEASRSRSTGGAGLGLAICRNIVVAHDGTIGAAHSPLGGLWIRVELPLDGGLS